MASGDFRAIVGRLTAETRSDLEAGGGMAVNLTNYNVEIEHWLSKIVERSACDLGSILKHYGIDHSRVLKEFETSIRKLKTGNGRMPGFSPDLMAAATEAWQVASLGFGATAVRSGHLLLALLEKDSGATLADASASLAKVDAADLRKNFAEITAQSPEAQGAINTAATPGAPGAPKVAGGSGASLAQFTTDLTQQARDGKIDEVIGRDEEVRQIVDVLLRRRQNNPILTGEAGVGKTAIVEGLALAVTRGQVPESLRTISILSLDLGLLQAGAGVKGEFENRLKSVIDEVKASPKPIVLFIDEAHTLIGAGGQAGQNDAANLLKPALARGELRTIAATTWAEYKKYFEKDPALTRRFQVVKVEEPSAEKAIQMMRRLAPSLQKHHGVQILDAAVVEAVKLSQRYISGRQLPDKAVSVLDTACARVALSQTSIPAGVEALTRAVENLTAEINALDAEQQLGGAHAPRLKELADAKAAREAELVDLSAKWKNESDRVADVKTARIALQKSIAAKGSDIEALKAALQTAQVELAAVQAARPMIHAQVTDQAVAEVVANWTGIPLGRMVSDELNNVLNLKPRMEERIIGQSHAIEAVSKAIRVSRAKLTDPRKPIGVFMFVGTSGVGKTETAVTLAELLYGGSQSLTTINMSEFKEEHKVSLLMGAPPGYVGYGEGGVLTEAVRKRPYSVVLLDELEKAHPGVQDVFYNVFDKGTIKDGEGRDIDFRNTLIIMTSNAGTNVIEQVIAQTGTGADLPDPDEMSDLLRPALLKSFKPAFLGRTTIVPFLPLSDDVLGKIIVLQLDKIKRRVQENYNATFTYDPSLIAFVKERCTETQSGARNIENILNQGLLSQLAGMILQRMADGGDIRTVRVGLTADSNFDIRFDDAPAGAAAAAAE